MNSFVTNFKTVANNRINFYKKKDFESSILNLLLVVMPTFFVLSLQAYSAAQGYSVFGILFGILVGILLLAIVNNLSPDALSKENFLLKVFALACPLILLFSYVIDKEYSSIFFLIFFALDFVILFFAFIFPVKNIGKKICATITLFSAFFMISYVFYSKDIFSPDSYTYLDISKTIFGNFYQVSTVRQYLYDSSMGTSFPFFFPFLIAICNGLTGFQIYSGVIVNVIASCITCYVLYKISKKYFKSLFPSTIATLFLMTNITYLDEIKSARSAPVAILLALIMVYCLLDLPRLQKRKAFIAGLAAGAGLMTNFDVITLAIFGALVVFLFAKKGQTIKKIVSYSAGFLVFVLPWILYSLINFGTFWVSDTQTLPFLVTPLTTQRYYSPGFVQQNIFNNYEAWSKQLIDYKLKYVWENGFTVSADGLILLALAIWAVVVIVNFTRGKPVKMYLKAQSKLLISTGAVFLIYIVKFVCTWIAGLSYSFYHIETWLMLIFFVAAVLYSFVAYCKDEKKIKILEESGNTTDSNVYCFNHKIATHSRILNYATIVVAVLVIFLSYLNVSEKFEGNILNSDLTTLSVNTSTIKAKVEALTSGDPVVFYPDKYDSAPFTFGSYTGIKTYAPPEIQDSDSEALSTIIENYIQPDFIVSANFAATRGDLVEKYGLQLVDSSVNLYQVTDKSAFAANKKLFAGQRNFY